MIKLSRKQLSAKVTSERQLKGVVGGASRTRQLPISCSDFISSRPPWVIASSRAELAVALIAITSSIGYVMGWVSSAKWNWLRPVSTLNVARRCIGERATREAGAR